MGIGFRRLTTILTIALLPLFTACGGGETPTDPGGDDGGDDPPQSADPPTFDFSGTDFSTDEDSTRSEDVSGVVSNGSLDSVTVASGAHRLETVDLSDGTLSLTPVPDANGPFTLTFWASNADTSATTDESAEIRALTDLLAGQLQDNETDSGRPGVLRLYDASDTSLVVEVDTDASGNWPKQGNFPEGDYLLQARIVENGEPNSYVRTVGPVGSDGSDIEVSPVRAVPYSGGESGLGLETNEVSPEEFKKHVCDPDPNLKPIERGIQYSRGTDACFNYHSRVDSFYIIESTTEKGMDLGEFTEEEQTILADEISNPISRWRNSGSYHVVLGPVDNPPFGRDEEGRMQPDDGWALVAPDSTKGTTLAESFGLSSDRVGDAGIIWMKQRRDVDGEEALRNVLTHEAGHIFGFRSHSEGVPGEKSVMAGLIPGTDYPTPIDIKSKRMAHSYPPGERPRDYTRLNFFGKQ